MITLGHDKITIIDDLKPKEHHSTYPAVIYTLNLLQAGGYNAWYYRSKEGTQETLNKTAFVMETGRHQALDCTEDPTNYGIILKACEHKMVKTCLQFQPNTTDDQTGQVCSPDQDQEPPVQTVTALHSNQNHTNLFLFQ